MRLLRWPADRLDTLGGYLTYHNVSLFVLFPDYLRGRAGRACDPRRRTRRDAGREILATGRSRPAMVLDRAVGFALRHRRHLHGPGRGRRRRAGRRRAGPRRITITMGTSGLVALVAYALGLLAAQLVRSSRAAGGVGAAALLGWDVATNMGERLGLERGVRFVSPFHYANQSRALVPGYGLDVVASLVLLALALVMRWDSRAGPSTRSDYSAPLWVPHARAHPTRAVGQPAHVPHRMLGSVWSAMLRRGWVGLAIWMAGAAGIIPR